MTAPVLPPSVPDPAIDPREARRQRIRDGLSPASVASQVGTFVLSAMAMGGLLAVSGNWGWAIAAIVALGIGLATVDELGPWLLTIRTVPVALVVVMVLVTVLAIVSPSSDAASFGVVVLLGVVVLGLDWRWAERLRPMVFLAGLVVVAAVASGEAWSLALVVVWLLAAMGTLSSIEQDRRRARPPVEPLSHAPTRPAPRRNDLASMVVAAAALAALAALVLSTPSCNPNFDAGGSEVGDGGSSSGGPGGEAPGGSPRQYVPDPDGNFLIPDDGSRGTPDGPLIPNFEDPPALGPDGEATVTTPDGTTLRYREYPDGTLGVEVEDPSGRVEYWEFQDRTDGLTRIDRYDEDGFPEDTYYYDPEGVLVDGTATGEVPPPEPAPEPEPDAEPDRDVNWGLIALVAVVIVALTALVLWLLNRPGKSTTVDPSVPPWAERLVRSIERAGAERGLVRRPGQSIVSYTQALHDGPLPDPSIVDIGELASAALFSSHPPSELAGEEASRRLEAMREQHPPADRGGRLSRSGAAR